MKRLFGTSCLSPFSRDGSFLRFSCGLMCGRALFDREVLERNSLLCHRFKAEPHRKNAVLDSMWKSLTIDRRKAYDKKANVVTLFSFNFGVGSRGVEDLITEDEVVNILRKDSRFDIFVPPFRSSVCAKSASSMLFKGIAKTTSTCLSRRCKRILLKRDVGDERGVIPKFLEPQRLRSRWTNMRYYRSFTDMLRVLAPTQKLLYFELCAHFSRADFSTQFLLAVTKRYNHLSEEKKWLFRPITNKEMLKFERFCCLHCGGMKKECIDIISLFADFRGLQSVSFSKHTFKKGNEKENPEEQRSAKEMQEVYKGILSCDSIHDGDFFRARRALGKLEALRSSDCGRYLFRRQQTQKGHTVVPTAAYTVRRFRELDDVSIAEMLTCTRQGSSVYDEVVDRVAGLRTKLHASQLRIYNVNDVVKRHLANVRLRKKGMHLTPCLSLGKGIEKFFRRSHRGRTQKRVSTTDIRGVTSIHSSSLSAPPSIKKRTPALGGTMRQKTSDTRFRSPAIHRRNQFFRISEKMHPPSKVFSSPKSVLRPIVKLLPSGKLKYNMSRVKNSSPSTFQISFAPSSNASRLHENRALVN